MADRRLHVCVCTNRSPAAAREAIAVAASQARELGGADAIAVISGLTDDAAALHARQADELGARMMTAPPGASAARNAALEQIPDDDVVAFLDDDAVPEPGWLARLEEHWSRAPADVACIGGAIPPRFESPPPRWMGPALWEAFSLLDRGPGVVEIHPEDGEDVWGANISFRAGEARAAGGFEEGVGPWADVPGFGEESDLQVRLRERGFRVLYAGDARVEHLVRAERLTLRSLWRRQLHRGFAAARSGRLARGRAALRAPKAAAGVLVALLGGNRQLAAERWGRVALNTGAVAAPLIGRRLRRRGWPG